MRQTKLSVGTQVNEGELHWEPINYLKSERMEAGIMTSIEVIPLDHDGLKFVAPTKNFTLNENVANLKQEDAEYSAKVGLDQ